MATSGASGGEWKIELSSFIKEDIQKNCDRSRVSIIHGETGSGKSTQVPQVLLDACFQHKADKRLVIVSQPRRLAAVSIARRVAKERSSILGDEVGYAIGNSSIRSDKTRLLFMTAGSLLQRIRSKGEEALSGVRFVVIDEVHERSCENDLLLACLRQMMLFAQKQKTSSPIKDVNLVLMSATFDKIRYKEYFSGLRGAETPLIAIPPLFFDENSTATRTEFFLEHAIQQIEDAQNDNKSLNLANKNTVLSAEEFKNEGKKRTEFLKNHSADASIHQQLYNIAADILLVYSHKVLSRQELAQNRYEPYRVIVFLPTLKSMEDMERTLFERQKVWRKHSMMKDDTLAIAISFLHSSYDVDNIVDSLDEKSGESSHQHPRERQVLLSTSIAETSVTIKDVGLVIDLCRSNQIFHDFKKRCSLAKIEWASKDSLVQRAGRTGRTCAGTIFHLVPATFAKHGLLQTEVPAVQRSSLQDEALMSFCSDSKATHNPWTLLSSCLDPPPDEHISDAIACLESLKAVKRTSQSTKTKSSKKIVTATPSSFTYKPTTYGYLLDKLPVSILTGRFIIDAARRGLGKEGVALAAIFTCTPTPITKVKGSTFAFQSTARYFASNVEVDNVNHVLEAQLGAVIAHSFWKLEHAAALGPKDHWSEFLAESYSSEMSAQASLMAYLEETSTNNNPLYDEAAWCKERGVGLRSLIEIRECMKSIESMIYSDDLNPFAASWLKNQCQMEKLARDYQEARGWVEAHSPDEIQLEIIKNKEELKKEADRMEEDSYYDDSEFDFELGGYHERAQKKAKSVYDGITSPYLLSVLGRSRYACLKTLIQERLAVIIPQEERILRIRQAQANNASSSARQVCTFFKQGRCKSGLNCRFSHDVKRAGEMEICSFFNSNVGCRYGATCSNLHIRTNDGNSSWGSAVEAKELSENPMKVIREKDLDFDASFSGESFAVKASEVHAELLLLDHNASSSKQEALLGEEGGSVLMLGEFSFAYAAEATPTFIKHGSDRGSGGVKATSRSSKTRTQSSSSSSSLSPFCVVATSYESTGNDVKAKKQKSSPFPASHLLPQHTLENIEEVIKHGGLVVKGVDVSNMGWMSAAQFGLDTKPENQNQRSTITNTSSLVAQGTTCSCPLFGKVIFNFPEVSDRACLSDELFISSESRLDQASTSLQSVTPKCCSICLSSHGTIIPAASLTPSFYEDLTPSNPVMQTSASTSTSCCSHVFHQSCLVNHRSYDNLLTCPLCRFGEKEEEEAAAAVSLSIEDDEELGKDGAGAGAGGGGRRVSSRLAEKKAVEEALLLTQMSSTSSGSMHGNEVKRNRILMFQLFQGIALLVARGLLSPAAAVHLRLHHSQLSRWDVLNIAKKNFYFLSDCFDEGDGESLIYTPLSSSDTPLKLRKVRHYVFKFCMSTPYSSSSKGLPASLYHHSSHHNEQQKSALDLMKVTFQSGWGQDYAWRQSLVSVVEEARK